MKRIMGILGLCALLLSVMACGLSATPRGSVETNPTAMPTSVPEAPPPVVAPAVGATGDKVIMTIKQVTIYEAHDYVLILFTFPHVMDPVEEDFEVWINGHRLYNMGLSLSKSDRMLDHYDQLLVTMKFPGADADPISWELWEGSILLGECSLHDIDKYPEGHDAIGDCVWPLPED